MYRQLKNVQNHVIFYLEYNIINFKVNHVLGLCYNVRFYLIRNNHNNDNNNNIVILYTTIYNIVVRSALN